MARLQIPNIHFFYFEAVSGFSLQSFLLLVIPNVVEGAFTGNKKGFPLQSGLGFFR
jgi:hypothetical protein